MHHGAKAYGTYGSNIHSIHSIYFFCKVSIASPDTFPYVFQGIWTYTLGKA